MSLTFFLGRRIRAKRRARKEQPLMMIDEQTTESPTTLPYSLQVLAALVLAALAVSPFR